MGGGANRFSSYGSILPRHGRQSSPGSSGRASQGGAGQPKSARHPPPCVEAARTRERLRHRIPLLSTSRFLLQAALRVHTAAQPRGQRFSSRCLLPGLRPGSRTLPPPGALAPGDPLSAAHLYLSRWPSFSFLICKVRTIISTTFTQHVTRRAKKRGDPL